MKINWNKRYTTYAIYAAIVSAAVIFCVFLGVYFKSIWGGFKFILGVISPLLYGCIIAYVLSPVLSFFEKKVLKKIRHGVFRRGIGVFLTYLVFITVIGLLLYAVVPQLGHSLQSLQSNLVNYSQTLQNWFANVSAESGFIASVVKTIMTTDIYVMLTSPINQIVDFIFELVKDSGSEIISFVGSFMGQLTKIVIGLIFSGYILCSKELLTAQFNKILHVIFSEKKITKIKNGLSYTDKTFGKYIMGMILDATIVGLLVAVAMLIFRMPYVPLISVLCACTNIIPIFGPFIGAIPSFIFIFISDPFKAIWFIVIILVIQQIDGSFVAPRVLGNSTGLPAIAVIIAITVMGGIFGIVGMVIAVPTFAVLSKLISDKTAEKAKKREAEEEGTQVTINDSEAVADTYEYYGDSHREHDHINDSGEEYRKEEPEDEAEEVSEGAEK